MTMRREEIQRGWGIAIGDDWDLVGQGAHADIARLAAFWINGRAVFGTRDVARWANDAVQAHWKGIGRKVRSKVVPITVTVEWTA